MTISDRVVEAHDIRLDEVTVGRARARMRVTAAMANQHGITHGGYVFLLADTAFAYASNSHPDSDRPVTVATAAQITFLRPVPADAELVAEAVERSRVGAAGIYDVTVSLAKPDGSGAVVAEFRGQSTTVARRLIGGSA